METYTQEQITDAMLYLNFDSDQICNLLNRLREKNGNPDERTADEKFEKATHKVAFSRSKCDDCPYSS